MKVLIGKEVIQIPAIPGYTILKELGEGGMGIVYLAREETLDTPVAIKLLHRQFVSKEQIKERFKNEARIMASLVHTNIVQFRRFLEIPDGLALVMEFVEGRGLDRIIGEEFGPIPWEKALPLFTQILQGLGYAHEKGIIHRDIKPSNIIVTESGEVKITDFGIAKLAGRSNLTKTGMQMGTLFYESPEQIRGAKNIDKRSDIYSLGMTLYEMLAGRLPFDSGENSSEFDITQQIVFKENPPPNVFYPHIPEWLVKIVVKATAKDPDQRFQSCEEFLSCIKSRKIPEAYSTAQSRDMKDEVSIQDSAAGISETRHLRENTHKGFPVTLIVVSVVFTIVIILFATGVFSKESTTNSNLRSNSSITVESSVPEPDVPEEETHDNSKDVFDPVNTIRPDVISTLAHSCRSRLVRNSELDELSYRELKLLRNYFFAYYNRPFAVSWIRNYFEDNMSSYRGNGPSDPQLTETERENVNRVIQYEQDHDIPVINY